MDKINNDYDTSPVCENPQQQDNMPNSERETKVESPKLGKRLTKKPAWMEDFVC
jgi:hypothetical protein